MVYNPLIRVVLMAHMTPDILWVFFASRFAAFRGGVGSGVISRLFRQVSLLTGLSRLQLGMLSLDQSEISAEQRYVCSQR